MHYSLYESMHTALKRILIKKEYSTYVIKQILKQNKKWGSKDRYFFAKFIYSSIRHLRRLAISVEMDWNDVQFFESLDDEKIDKLLVSWFVIIDEGLIKESVEFQKVSWHFVLKQKEQALTFSKKKEYKKIIEIWKNINVRKEIYSISDTLDEVAYKELGEKWNSILSELDKEASVYLRVNTSKISLDNLIEKLKEEGVLVKKEITPLQTECLSLFKRQNVFLTPSFKEGLFEVQDIHSQCVAAFLDVKPGQYIVDACAGAGGKSLHIANLLNFKGKVLALDIVEKKLKELRRRAIRAGVSDIIETRAITNKTIKRLHSRADVVLLDVPCSGLGVLKRHPESKWRFNKDDLDNLHKEQSFILSNYSKIVKPKGQLVYATCSILPSENQLIVDTFLAQENKNTIVWKKNKECILEPKKGDGFFICKLEKLN
ncbi:MAG: RsmB/NOP family class I SAM-dependent RNA methyltransferase [Bdellovibrionaceae bacterium]|nr:RsmB/NOP family class I SAM-dependent RNA methyltransferase [Pseudobdellovibrionaceae bacterium]